MDRTALFKATVKTIRTKNKALGVKEVSRDILSSNRQKSEFGSRAKDVVRSAYSFFHIYRMVQKGTEVVNKESLIDASVFSFNSWGILRSSKTSFWNIRKTTLVHSGN